ncbi:hypothetical protein [Massilia timonae]|nr:hypothetical protein [Massilia timonae]
MQGEGPPLGSAGLERREQGGFEFLVFCGGGLRQAAAQRQGQKRGEE